MMHEKDMESAEQAARDAVGSHAMEGNLKALAMLAESADRQQQAEHIRGVVATTMAHLSAQATTATQAHAAKWRTWALSLTDGLDEVPGAPLSALT
jgi:hypothetical protein